MTNKKLNLVESIRNTLNSIDEAKSGWGVIPDILGVGAVKAAQKLGKSVRLVGADGQVEIWEQIPNSTTYVLTSRTGMGGQAVKKEADELLKAYNDQIAKGTRAEPKMDQPGPTRTTNPGDELGDIIKAIDQEKRTVESMVKTGGKIHLTPAMMAEIKAGLTFEEVVAKHFPDAFAKMKASPKKELQFWQTVNQKARSNKRILIAAILIALGLLAVKDKVTPQSAEQDDAPQGLKTSDAEAGAAPGTIIPGDQVPWAYVLGGSVPEQFAGLRGQGLTKKEDGKWYADNGSGTANTEVVKRIEELAQRDPESRKAMVQYENSTKVELHSAPPEVAPVNPASGEEKADIAIAPAEPASSSTIKKKKKDEKVLPPSKW